MSDVGSRVRALTDEIVRLREYEARLARLPQEDDFPDETVIFFKKVFDSGQAYRMDVNTGWAYGFVVMKVEATGKWYLTGERHGGAWEWHRLREFMADGVDLDDAWIVSAWAPAFPA